jgi:hypothetical protein
MLKDMKPGREYFIINIDEPYAAEIFEVLKRGQMAKGEWPEGDISFEEWQELTFGKVREERKRESANYCDVKRRVGKHEHSRASW